MKSDFTRTPQSFDGDGPEPSAITWRDETIPRFDRDKPARCADTLFSLDRVMMLV